MRFLILSDIHSNLEALNTVLEHAAGQYDQVLCCGDIVGYGPDPNAVIERIREFNPRVIRGNHEKAALGLVDLSLFNPLAKRAALWTQDELTTDNRNYLKEIQAGPWMYLRSRWSTVRCWMKISISSTWKTRWKTSPWLGIL